MDHRMMSKTTQFCRVWLSYAQPFSKLYDYNWLTDNKKWRPLAGAENLVSTLYGNIGVIGLCFILLSV